MCNFYIAANAVEIKIEGKGIAPLTGYDIKSVRNKQDYKMKKKAQNSDLEVLQTQQIKEASRQAETRKKQDERMGNAVRQTVITEAQENALKAGIRVLINRTLGANASNNPQVMEKFDEILSQSSSYIIDENYTGEIKDNNYVAHAYLTVDETEFRTLLSDMGVAINTQTIRAKSIMIILDEFFAQPSNLHDNVLTKEVTTYDYKYNEKDKKTTKAAYKDSYNNRDSMGYANLYGGGSASSSVKNSSSANYGNYIDYSQNESEFYQNIKEYAPKTPHAQNLNYTQPALQNAFTTYDIRALDNDIFKSKYFKGKSITSDRLANSSELANYVKAARDEAHADYFAIGVSYITDNGQNVNTGKSVADGNVFVKVYSTLDGEVIASGSFTETASGNSADQARTAVANKIGNELGEVLSKKIQDYWKRRMMYGSEYIVQIKGNFTAPERVMINKTLQNTDGIKNVSLRISDSTKSEYIVNYSGQEPFADALFMKLYTSSLSSKFKNYDYKIDGNQLIFAPIK